MTRPAPCMLALLVYQHVGAADWYVCHHSTFDKQVERRLTHPKVPQVSNWPSRHSTLVRK